MKRTSKARFTNKELYEKLDADYKMEDTRYYGVFFTGQGKDQRIKIDPKRYAKRFELTEEMLSVINKRNGHYFLPLKQSYNDYKCNIVIDVIKGVKKDWNEIFLPRIEAEIKKINAKEYTIGDDELFTSGIIEPDEAYMNANMRNWRAQAEANAKRRKLYLSLYSQFFHQMVSTIEAATVEVITLGGWEETHFNRDVFYAFKGAKHERVKDLNGFAAYDKMYLIWHFIKHNSLSTYESLKANYPEALVKIPKGEESYKYCQGNLAIYYVDFSEKLINELFAGVEQFFKEYCRLVFEEDYAQAQWNYDNYFASQVNDEIECLRNPLGLPDWI